MNAQDAGFDAPAPVVYENDPAQYAGGARPTPMSGIPQYQPSAYMPQQGAPMYQPYMPQYQPYGQQPEVQPAQQTPAANEKDSLGVPAFLRRERK